MIVIDPIIVNNIFLRFGNPLEQDSYYLFEFTNPLTNEVKTFTTEDISTSLCVYHQFEISNSDSPEDLYNGILDLESGSWEYTVYEMPNVSPISLDKADSLQIMDFGKVLVNEIEVITPSYEVPTVVIPTNKI